MGDFLNELFDNWIPPELPLDENYVEASPIETCHISFGEETPWLLT